MLKDASEEISIWKRGGSFEVGHLIHVVDDYQGVVNRVASYEAVDSFEGYLIVSFFGIVFGVQHSDKDVVKEARLGKEDMIWGCDFVACRLPVSVDMQSEQGKDLLPFFRLRKGVLSR